MWFVARDKKDHQFKDREGHVLFIDARKLGTMVDRRHRELTYEDTKKISETYHTWRGELIDKKYQDVAGFCKSASVEDIRKHERTLTPGTYVGAEDEEEEDEAFEEKIDRLMSELAKQMEEGRKLDGDIMKNLARIGF